MPVGLTCSSRLVFANWSYEEAYFGTNISFFSLFFFFAGDVYACVVVVSEVAMSIRVFAALLLCWSSVVVSSEGLLLRSSICIGDF